MKQPKFRITLKDVFDTLSLHNLTRAFQNGSIREAKIKVIFLGNKRGKTITLTGTNKKFANSVWQIFNESR